MIKKIRNIFSFALALIVLMGVSTGIFSSTAQAADGETTVIVNKVKFSQAEIEDNPKVSITNDGNITGTYQNDGGTIAELDAKAKVQGAEFTVYNATDRFYTLMGAPSATMDDVLKQIIAGGPSGLTAVPGARGYTNASGQIRFDLENRDAGSRNNVYLIVETDAPPFISNYAQPIALMLPMSDDSGNTLAEFNVYPKNMEVDPKKELDEEVITVNGKEVGSFDVGAPIKYYTEFTMPIKINANKAGTNEKLYTKLEVTDTPSANLKFNNISSIQYYNGTSWVSTGLVKDTDYTISPYTGTAPLDGQGFKLAFNLPTVLSKLDAFAGSKIRINYTMYLTEGSVPEATENNEVEIKFTHNGNDYSETDPADPVITGGKRFEKIDSKDDTIKLSGAEFVIKRVAGTPGTYEYAKFLDSSANKITNISNTDNAASIVWGSKQDASVLVSSANGSFTAAGLDFGAYILEEISAPSGYVLPADPNTNFTVEEGSWTTTNILQIHNFRRGTLPQTGEKGIIIFLLIGALLMSSAILWYGYSKKKTNSYHS